MLPHNRGELIFDGSCVNSTSNSGSLCLTSTKTMTESSEAKVQIKLSFPVKAPQQPKKPRMNRNTPKVPTMKAPSAQCPSQNAKYFGRFSVNCKLILQGAPQTYAS